MPNNSRIWRLALFVFILAVLSYAGLLLFWPNLAIQSIAPILRIKPLQPFLLKSIKFPEEARIVYVPPVGADIIDVNLQYSKPRTLFAGKLEFKEFLIGDANFAGGVYLIEQNHKLYLKIQVKDPALWLLTLYYLRNPNASIDKLQSFKNSKAFKDLYEVISGNTYILIGDLKNFAFMDSIVPSDVSEVPFFVKNVRRAYWNDTPWIDIKLGITKEFVAKLNELVGENTGNPIYSYILETILEYYDISDIEKINIDLLGKWEGFSFVPEVIKIEMPLPLVLRSKFSAYVELLENTNDKELESFKTLNKYKQSYLNYIRMVLNENRLILGNAKIEKQKISEFTISKTMDLSTFTNLILYNFKK